MPLRDDLLQRTLEQLAAAVRALAGLSGSAGQAEDLERLIAAAYQEHTGSAASALRGLPSAELLPMLSSAGVLDREKTYLLAALSEAEAELALLQGEAEDSRHRLRSLELYLAVALADPNAPEVAANIARLENALGAYLLPEATEWRLFEHALAQARYAEAEDRLFALLGRLGPTPALRAAGEDFYRALERLGDADLTAGGLPRDEVAEGKAAFAAALERGG